MKPLCFLLPLVLFIAPACQSDKDNVTPFSTPAPPPTIIVSEDGATGVPLAQVRVEDATISGVLSQLILTGNLSDGRTLSLRYHGTATQPAGSTLIPLAEMDLGRFYSPYNEMSESGKAISGSAINNTATKFADGTFAGSFSGGTVLSGTFSLAQTK